MTNCLYDYDVTDWDLKCYVPLGSSELIPKHEEVLERVIPFHMRCFWLFAMRCCLPDTFLAHVNRKSSFLSPSKLSLTNFPKHCSFQVVLIV